MGARKRACLWCTHWPGINCGQDDGEHEMLNLDDATSPQGVVVDIWASWLETSALAEERLSNGEYPYHDQSQYLG